MTHLSTITILATFALVSTACAQTQHRHLAVARAPVQKSDRYDGLQTGRSVATVQQSPSANHATYDFGLKND